MWPETPDAVMRNGKWSLELGDRIFMFHGEKNEEGSMHGDMRTLRMLLREAAEKKVTLVGLDECLGDSTDGAYKQADGTCRDDACLCTASVPGLPSTAAATCYRGNLTRQVKMVQLVHPDMPDQCKHSLEKYPRDILSYQYVDGQATRTCTALASSE